MTPTEWEDADRQAIEQLKKSGTGGPFEKEYFRKDGSRVPVLIGVALFEGSENEGVAFVLDLTEKKEAEKRQRVMVDELNHRVKNTLATVMALSAQTFRTAPSQEAFCEAFEGRLLALSQTHNLLDRSFWTGAGLGDILTQELAPYTGADGRSFTLDGDDLKLGPVTAVTLGMVFHELATNAVKYGALSVAGGKVLVAWRVSGPGRLHVEMAGNGGATGVTAPAPGLRVPPDRTGPRQRLGWRCPALLPKRRRALPHEYTTGPHLDPLKEARMKQEEDPGGRRRIFDRQGLCGFGLQRGRSCLKSQTGNAANRTEVETRTGAFPRSQCDRSPGPQSWRRPRVGRRSPRACGAKGLDDHRSAREFFAICMEVRCDCSASEACPDRPAKRDAIGAHRDDGRRRVRPGRGQARRILRRSLDDGKTVRIDADVGIAIARMRRDRC